MGVDGEIVPAAWAVGKAAAAVKAGFFDCPAEQFQRESLDEERPATAGLCIWGRD